MTASESNGPNSAPALGATEAPAPRAPVDVFVLMPLPGTGAGVSYTCMSIMRNLGANFRSDIVTPYGVRSPDDPFSLTQTLPAPLRLLPYRKIRALAAALNEQSFFAAVTRSAETRGSAIAYVWPDPSVSLLRRLRDCGVTIVREMINCHRGTAKPILDAEYARLGLPLDHTVSARSVDFETEALSYCDYVLCSNPLAENSVVANGVPPARVKGVSFGWDPARLRGDARALAPIEGPTFLFVGLICVRKGAHLLLRYWARSGIRGRLVLVGALEPAIAKTCSEYLDRPDVTLVNHSRNIGDYYRSADAFVFPTVEEGGPQVTYEAAGCGLPLITTPMGAARLADDTTGYVLDPFDEEGWIAAMCSIAADRDLGLRMGANARRKAGPFTWESVGRLRGRVFEDIVGLAPGAARAADRLVPSADPPQAGATPAVAGGRKAFRSA